MKLMKEKIEKHKSALGVVIGALSKMKGREIRFLRKSKVHF